MELRLLGSEIVAREALSAGESAARLERVRLADGREIVVKWMRPRADWQMRVTNDAGVRDALVFTSGLLGRLPNGIAHPILEILKVDDEVAIVMRDVAGGLIAAGQNVTRDDTFRILAAATAMHRHFRGTSCDGLCSVEDRYTLLSPDVVAKEQDGPSSIPRFALAGWQEFDRTASAQVADGIAIIHDDPSRFADALRGCGTTLIHGDLHLANVALLDGEVVLLDWGLLTTFAPPAVEFAYFLAMRDHHATVEAIREELIADYLTLAPETSQRELRLAFLGSVVMFGWALALRGSVDPDGHEELQWWLTQAELGLGEL